MGNIKELFIFFCLLSVVFPLIYCEKNNEKKIHFKIELLDNDFLLSNDHLKKEKNIFQSGNKLKIKTFEKIQGNVLERAIVVEQVNKLKSGNVEENGISLEDSSDDNTGSNNDVNKNKMKVISSEESVENDIHMLRKVYQKTLPDITTTYCYIRYTFNLNLEKLSESNKSEIFKGINNSLDYTSFLPKDKMNVTESILENEYTNIDKSEGSNGSIISNLELINGDIETENTNEEYIKTVDDIIDYFDDNNDTLSIPIPIKNKLISEKKNLIEYNQSKNYEDPEINKEHMETIGFYEMLKMLKNSFFMTKNLKSLSQNINEKKDNKIDIEKDIDGIFINSIINIFGCYDTLKKNNKIDSIFMSIENKNNINRYAEIHDHNFSNKSPRRDMLNESFININEDDGECESFLKSILQNKIFENDSRASENEQNMSFDTEMGNQEGTEENYLKSGDSFDNSSNINILKPSVRKLYNTPSNFDYNNNDNTEELSSMEGIHTDLGDIESFAEISDKLRNCDIFDESDGNDDDNSDEGEDYNDEGKDYNDVDEDYNDVDEDYNDVDEDYNDVDDDYSDEDEDYNDVDEDYNDEDEDYSDEDEDYNDVDEDYSDEDEDYNDVDEDYSDVDEDYNDVDEDYSDVDEDYSDEDEDYNDVDEDYNDVDEDYSDVDEDYSDEDEDYNDVDEDYNDEDDENDDISWDDNSDNGVFAREYVDKNNMNRRMDYDGYNKNGNFVEDENDAINRTEEIGIEDVVGALLRVGTKKIKGLGKTDTAKKIKKNMSISNLSGKVNGIMGNIKNAAKKTISKPQKEISNSINNIKRHGENIVDQTKREIKKNTNNIKVSTINGMNNIKNQATQGINKLKNGMKKNVNVMKEKSKSFSDKATNAGKSSINQLKNKAKNGIKNVKKGGNKIANKVVKGSKDTVNKLENKAKKGVETVKEKTENAIDRVAKVIKDGANKLEQEAKKGVEAVKVKTENAVDKVTKTAKDNGDKLKKEAKKGVEAVKVKTENAVDKVTKTAKDNGDKLKKEAKKGVEAVKVKTENAVDKAVKVVKDGANKLENETKKGVEAVKVKTENAVDKAVKVVKDGANKLENEAKKVVKEIKTKGDKIIDNGEKYAKNITGKVLTETKNTVENITKEVEKGIKDNKTGIKASSTNLENNKNGGINKTNEGLNKEKNSTKTKDVLPASPKKGAKSTPVNKNSNSKTSLLSISDDINEESLNKENIKKEINKIDKEYKKLKKMEKKLNEELKNPSPSDTQIIHEFDEYEKTVEKKNKKL
ncbi:secreted ookinete protein, putative [Plasmodium berghei]|uniref:Secreted ookinete protein, putative n=1 Tax=Plasmodium berghei TaxID=5821 RepID=A0A1C6YLP0_PLABE|nr:secreted ookinete protein, putative [Plasmodium berghei]SCN27025.1 secreted ookinete protein, putative [Plasmodium berghei]SCO61470.1 secreted ookinete protein, putative [Plasmodium berghei]